MPISNEYINNLPDIYRDILAAFPQFNPTRKVGYGLSCQSLYSALDGKYTLGQIIKACGNMAEGGDGDQARDIRLSDPPRRGTDYGNYGYRYTYAGSGTLPFAARMGYLNDRRLEGRASAALYPSRVPLSLC